MTILAASIWNSRVSIVVDRQISRRSATGLQVVQQEASKLLVVFCGNALFSIAYTGIAVADSVWMDEAIASCLAFRQIEPAMLQPGSWFLRRPIHEILRNLAFNLPIRLRSTPSIASQGLTLVLTGWHLRPRPQPFIWELTWHEAANRIGGSLAINRHQVAKHFRHCPNGLWLQTWGDTGSIFEKTMQELGGTQGFTHDDVERFIVNAIVARSQDTATVGDQSLALQMDLHDPEWQVQFTYYPGISAVDPHSFLSGWLLAPTSIHSPVRESTSGGVYSSCNRYVMGGFSDPNAGLTVRTRLPLQSMRYGGPLTISCQAEKRMPPPLR